MGELEVNCLTDMRSVTLHVKERRETKHQKYKLNSQKWPCFNSVLGKAISAANSDRLALPFYSFFDAAKDSSKKQADKTV
jgi:hypothetical protein